MFVRVPNCESVTDSQYTLFILLAVSEVTAAVEHLAILVCAKEISASCERGISRNPWCPV